MKVLAITLCSLALLCTFTAAWADVPTKMSVQGRLTNGAGAPVPAGLKNFTFKIFDQQAGGMEIWPAGPGETQTLTTDANGLWNGSVGQVLPLTETVFQNPVRWLEVRVDDGVNPPETLPRIELKTHPYTYRAASSQHADSLGNASYTDLMNQFVDVPGDVMTGPLANNWTQKNIGSSLEINNLNDVPFPFWNDGSGAWGLSADVSGDNNYWNIGVAAAARGNNQQSEGNRGVYAYADGIGTQNVGVEGWTGMSGTANYSGYFHGGDFLVSSTQTPGTGGVLLPSDAIDATEILDEPGLAAAQSTALIVLSCGVSTDLLSVSITIPGPGYVVVDARCWAEAGSSTGGVIGGGVAIDEVGGGPLLSPYQAIFQQQLPTGGYYFIDVPVSTYRIFFKSSAGTYTFHLNGTKYGNCPGGYTAIVRDFMMRATYYSTSYGSVATLASADDVGQFDKAQSVAVPTGPDRDAPTVPMYQVDLRELELKAARTAAAAEQARSELLEARLGAVRSQIQALDASGKELKQ